MAIVGRLLLTTPRWRSLAAYVLYGPQIFRSDKFWVGNSAILIILELEVLDGLTSYTIASSRPFDFEVLFRRHE